MHKRSVLPPDSGVNWASMFMGVGPEMHGYAKRAYLPKPKRTKGCGMCSLKDECLPKLERLPSAGSYNEENLGGTTA